MGAMPLRLSAQIFLFLGILGCSPANTQPVEPEPLQPDLLVVVSCRKAEAHLLELQCRDSGGRLLGGPNLHAEPFHAICENAIANSVNVNPTCLAAVKTCQEVNSCHR